MGVIIFVRDGKGQDIEGSKRPLGLQGEEGGFRSAVFRDILRVRKKGSLTNGLGSLVEEPVDGLKPQVGHGRVIAVGIRQGDGKLRPPVLELREGEDLTFLGKEVVGFFTELSGHY
jgi:hypothetical protein